LSGKQEFPPPHEVGKEKSSHIPEKIIITDEAAKSLYSVSFHKSRIDSIAFAGGTPALPGLFAASSLLRHPKQMP